MSCRPPPVGLGLGGPEAVSTAAEELLTAARDPGAPDGDGPADGADLLVARMVRGARELVAGLHTDPQFGRCVMVGLGGVLTEALGDVAFRLVPLDADDALDALDELHAQALLDAFTMRLVDAQLAFPGILIYLMLATLVREWKLAGFWNDLALIFALGINQIPRLARLVRGTVLAEKEKEYVEA